MIIYRRKIKEESNQGPSQISLGRDKGCFSAVLTVVKHRHEMCLVEQMGESFQSKSSPTLCRLANPSNHTFSMRMQPIYLFIIKCIILILTV